MKSPPGRSPQEKLTEPQSEETIPTVQVRKATPGILRAHFVPRDCMMQTVSALSQREGWEKRRRCWCPTKLRPVCGRLRRESLTPDRAVEVTDSS